MQLFSFFMFPTYFPFTILVLCCSVWKPKKEKFSFVACSELYSSRSDFDLWIYYPKIFLFLRKDHIFHIESLFLSLSPAPFSQRRRCRMMMIVTFHQKLFSLLCFRFCLAGKTFQDFSHFWTFFCPFSSLVFIPRIVSSWRHQKKGANLK